MDTQLQKQLENQLRKIINEKDLTEFQASINKIALELDADSMDCAAALLCLLQKHFKLPHEKKIQRVKQVHASEILGLQMLWYRLEVGREHRVTVDGLKRLLVEESGVENRLIRRIDIRDRHTLIQLPGGMPQELLQHLKTVVINQQKLDIKRLKKRPKRKSRAIRNKEKRSGIAGHMENKTMTQSDNNQKKTQTNESRDKRVTSHFLSER